MRSGWVGATRRPRPPGSPVGPIRDEPLQGGDRDRAVQQRARAGIFTTVVAHPAADAGERVLVVNDLKRVFVAALGDERDIPLRPLMDGAGVAAGRPPPLVGRGRARGGP